jgi:hypothetical protein
MKSKKDSLMQGLSSYCPLNVDDKGSARKLTYAIVTFNLYQQIT